MLQWCLSVRAVLPNCGIVPSEGCYWLCILIVRFVSSRIKVNIPGILATLVYISSNISYICHVWHHMTLTIGKEA